MKTPGFLNLTKYTYPSDFDNNGKPIYNTSMDQKEFASLGGKAILAKKGKDYFKELAKKSVASRKAKRDLASVLPIDNG